MKIELPQDLIDTLTKYRKDPTSYTTQDLALVGAKVLMLFNAARQCRAHWVQGMLQAPGEPEKPSGRCSLEAGHEGKHCFPNNNWQGDETKMPEANREFQDPGPRQFIK